MNTFLPSALLLALAAVLATPAATNAARADAPVVDLRDKQEPLIPVIPPMKKTAAVTIQPWPLPEPKPQPGDRDIVQPKPIMSETVAFNGDDDGCIRRPVKKPGHWNLVARDTADSCTQGPAPVREHRPPAVAAVRG